MSDADGEKVAATDEENVFRESNEEDDAIGSVSSAALHAMVESPLLCALQCRTIYRAHLSICYCILY